MKIEVGKSYKAKNGRRVDIIQEIRTGYTGKFGKKPFKFAAIVHGNKSELEFDFVEQYNEDGQSGDVMSEGEAEDFTIISEWVDVEEGEFYIYYEEDDIDGGGTFPDFNLEHFSHFDTEEAAREHGGRNAKIYKIKIEQIL